MSDHTELKRLAEAFPTDLDWDSNTEPFFNGPSGESLGGGPTGFYCVYGPAFEIDDEQYDGPTYVESCKADFAKFMVAARDGVLALIAENEELSKDAARYRWTCVEGNWVARFHGKWRAHVGEYGDKSPTDWYPSRGEAIDAAMTAGVST